MNIQEQVKNDLSTLFDKHAEWAMSPNDEAKNLNTELNQQLKNIVDNMANDEYRKESIEYFKKNDSEFNYLKDSLPFNQEERKQIELYHDIDSSLKKIDKAFEKNIDIDIDINDYYIYQENSSETIDELNELRTKNQNIISDTINQMKEKAQDPDYKEALYDYLSRPENHKMINTYSYELLKSIPKFGIDEFKNFVSEYRYSDIYYPDKNNGTDKLSALLEKYKDNEAVMSYISQEILNDSSLRSQLISDNNKENVKELLNPIVDHIINETSKDLSRTAFENLVDNTRHYTEKALNESMDVVRVEVPKKFLGMSIPFLKEEREEIVFDKKLAEQSKQLDRLSNDLKSGKEVTHKDFMDIVKCDQNTLNQELRLVAQTILKEKVYGELSFQNSDTKTNIDHKITQAVNKAIPTHEDKQKTYSEQFTQHFKQATEKVAQQHQKVSQSQSVKM